MKFLCICTDMCFKQAFKYPTLCRNALRRLVENSARCFLQQQLTVPIPEVRECN